jgi:hypothetical protein
MVFGATPDPEGHVVSGGSSYSATD